ncbi:tetratricopeptide repeat protein [Streptomyces cellostaticus]|uniref:tetratricopeptide repeat protein n=1 Tax=Streptomyces cellostaticus TaxID=67285 RepID=UPI0020264CCE|nr:tetratricopeptide repeat protein [Streptomyces cellostaticus]
MPVQVSGTGDAIAKGPGAFAVSGNMTVVQPRAPQEPAPWPHQVGLIPARANCFQDRAEVERLRQALVGGGTAVVGQVLAGMGGVGKTQLAADYAHAAWQTAGVDVLVWVTATSRSAVVSGYAQAGVELCRADPNDADQSAASFLAWLTAQAAARSCRWLIVLDDITDPADLRGLWPPISPHGRILVTTRRRDAALTAAGRRLIQVGLFSQAEAVAYLTQVLASHGRTEPADQLAALADDLGRLPLALSQAAAYLADAGLSGAAYRALLADRASALADALPDVLPDDQAVTAAAAWALSIDRADALRPKGLARPMLQLAAFLDANGIPEAVLTSKPALAHLRGKDGPRDGGPAPGRDAIGALRTLHRLHLIDHTPDTPHQSVRVHQLVQRAVRDTLIPHQYGQTARTAADALIAAWPSIERDTDLAHALRANTTALTACAEDALHWPDRHTVLNRAGTSLGETGQVTAARSYFQHLADTTHVYLGADHPNTLSARSNVAYWQGQTGDATGAATAYVELLNDHLRVLGEDHPNTLTTRSQLARWRGQAGDATGAATAYVELLNDCMRVLGEDHPETLTTRSNVAYWQGQTGDATGAATAYVELLNDHLRVLGEDHPNTLNVRSQLARWRGQAGDATGAATAFAELLNDCMRVLGEDHPNTLNVRSNVAYWRGQAGDATGAATAYAELLNDHLRVLGEDHPNTLNVRSHVAYWQGQTGDATGAATAFAELLNDHLRVLGEDHPNTLNVRSQLARWRGQAGDATGAATAFAELLNDRVRVLGEDHPNTLTTRSQLARWRGQAGDATGAATAYAELLNDCMRVLGEDHPETLTTRSNVAYWQGQAGQDGSAVR